MNTNVAEKKAQAKAKALRVVEVADSKRELFNSIMKNLRPLYTVNGEVLTKTGDIPLSLLVIDDSYQGFRCHNKLNSLITNWDYRKLDLITIVPHEDTCNFAVVDGQGRTLAARALHLDSLCAKVLMDAPSDPEERLKYEANIFVRQDDQLEKLRAVEKHLAFSIVGNPAAEIMNKVMKKYHVDFVDTKGSRSSRILGSYQETFDIARIQGEDCLEFIFSIIENAGWGDAVNGYNTAIVKALRNVYVVHDTANQRELMQDYLSDTLRAYEPSVFMANAKTKYPVRDRRVAVSLYLEDMLVDARIVTRKIYEDKNKALKVISKVKKPSKRKEK